MPNRSLVTILAATPLMLLAETAFAQDAEFPFGDWSGGVAFNTDYVFRGISQTEGEPALQGRFTWNHESGAYLDAWGSNVNFEGIPDAHLEIDWKLGFKNTVHGVSYNAWAVYKTYPGADDELDLDFFEAHIDLGYDFGFASVRGDFNYSPEYFAGTGEELYTRGTVNIPLPYNFGLDAWIGHFAIEDEENFGVDDYRDWSVGLTYSRWGFDFDLRYTDTDLTDNECRDICDARGVFAVSRTF